MTKWTRSAPIPTASIAAASSALTFSGPRASGATTGRRPAESASRTAGGVLGCGVPDQPQLGYLLGFETDLVAHQADGALADGLDEMAVDLLECLANHQQRLRGRHAPAVARR